MGRGRRARRHGLGNGRPSYRGGRRAGWWSGIYRFVAARGETESHRQQKQSISALCHMLRSHGPK